MIEIDKGHIYEVDSYDGVGKQTIKFMKRLGPNYPGNKLPIYRGTNLQEVLRVLISRCIYLNNQIPCTETAAIILLLRNSILLLEMRAKRIKGKELAIQQIDLIEDYPTCRVCGHILCDEHK